MSADPALTVARGRGADTPSSRAPSPLRVAFVGQAVYFEQCALEQPTEGVEPFFLDFRAAAPPAPLRAAIAKLRPDVIVVFRPEIIPPRLFAGLDAITLGYLTEPLPREKGVKHADLDARLWWLEQVDASNFDRVLCFDPLIAQTATKVLPIWRSLPIPVADSLFMEVSPRQAPPKLLFVARSTEHREWMLAEAKRKHIIAHIGHGLFGEPLRRFLARADIQVNLHNNPYPTFENRVCIALAAGHLLISEPLSPSHDLRPGVDFLEVSTPKELCALLDALAADPRLHLDVQEAGRTAAERFRASKVYPSLIREAIDAVAQQGGRHGRQ